MKELPESMFIKWTCARCGKRIQGEIRILRGKPYHAACYEQGIKNLLRFLDKLELPDDEFEQWLADES